MKNFFFGLLLFSNGIIAQQLSLQQANHLATLPLKCLQQEYPNKLNQLLLNATEIQSPAQLHPAFYGCFDWHSSVHGHWSLMYLLNHFPDLANKNEIKKKKKIEGTSKKSHQKFYGWFPVISVTDSVPGVPGPSVKLPIHMS